MHWYLDVLKKYGVVEGRASRPEFWMFYLFQFIIIFVLTLIGGRHGWLALIYMLATLVPSIAVNARRLHDVNKSGWWQLTYNIPLVGLVLLLLWNCTGGDEGDNDYGPPAAAAAE